MFMCMYTHMCYEMKNKDVDRNSMLGRVVSWKGKQEYINEKKSMPSRGKNTTMFSRHNRMKKNSNKDLVFLLLHGKSRKSPIVV